MVWQLLYLPLAALASIPSISKVNNGHVLLYILPGIFSLGSLISISLLTLRGEERGIVGYYWIMDPYKFESETFKQA
jgi:hypothetical protein